LVSSYFRICNSWFGYILLLRRFFEAQRQKPRGRNGRTKKTQRGHRAKQQFVTLARYPFMKTFYTALMMLVSSVVCGQANVKLFGKDWFLNGVNASFNFNHTNTLNPKYNTNDILSAMDMHELYFERNGSAIRETVHQENYIVDDMRGGVKLNVNFKRNTFEKKIKFHELRFGFDYSKSFLHGLTTTTKKGAYNFYPQSHDISIDASYLANSKPFGKRKYWAAYTGAGILAGNGVASRVYLIDDPAHAGSQLSGYGFYTNNHYATKYHLNTPFNVGIYIPVGLKYNLDCDWNVFWEYQFQVKWKTYSSQFNFFQNMHTFMFGVRYKLYKEAAQEPAERKKSPFLW
jgi:hypothetical protein